MRKYLSYDNYKDVGGKLSKAEFDRFAFRAECELNNATLGRLAKLEFIPESVKRCEFELITYFSLTAKNGDNSSITSISNDGYSTSYSEQKSPQNQIQDIIYTYLADDENNLLYCGVN